MINNKTKAEDVPTSSAFVLLFVKTLEANTSFGNQRAHILLR